MTPKQKAEELVWMYSRELRIWDLKNIFISKKCALIVIDEMLKMDVQLLSYNKYLQEVKQEIEKL